MGSSSAAPTPLTARPARSIAVPVAAAHITLPNAKSAMPHAKMRRRP